MLMCFVSMPGTSKSGDVTNVSFKAWTTIKQSCRSNNIAKKYLYESSYKKQIYPSFSPSTEDL